MPTYKFWCTVCNAEREVMQPHSAPGPFCARCEDEGTQSYPVRMVRIPSVSNFIMRGFSAGNGYS